MCEAYGEKISRLLDGDLTEQEEAELRAHLRTCPSFREEYRAISGAAALLRGSLSEPPDGFSESVMTRIAAAPKRRRRVSRALLAACLALALLAGGAVGLRRMRFGAAAEATVTEQADAGYGYTGSSAGMPEPAPEEVVEEAAPEAAEREAASADDDSIPEAPGSIDAPVLVPEDRQADFEALLGDAGVTPSEERTVIAYVEYRGVIYEFSRDGDALVWRDAAEGMAVTSPATEDALWRVLAGG